ncbi:MAG TPA: hypothetical protein VGO11_17225 [Chthoniobacteraceae bacterium]|nr:hypothetical protein [Chthoniobacteraceae bacterium]
MKTAILSLALLTAAASAEPPPEPPGSPELQRAYVTIPYSELRALWEAAQRKPAPVVPPEVAPMPFLVHRAEVRIALGETASKIDADFEVEALEKTWQRIPLLGGEARLDKSESGERSIVWDDGGYALLTNAPGKTPVVLHLVTGGARQGAAPLKLKLGSASVKRLSISGIPAGLEARVNGQAAQAVDGAAIFLLPGEAGEISLELAALSKVEAPKPPAPITPSHWQTQSQLLVRYAEGRLLFNAHVAARASDGSGLDLLLALPANTTAIKVAGEDLADWSQTRLDDGSRALSVRWKTRDVLDRDLTVAYAVPQSSFAEQWTLQAPISADDKDARHLYAIVPAEGLELKGDTLRAAVESRRLPEWMRTEIGGAAFVTSEGAAQLVLQTHWLPTIATAEAIVSDAKSALRLVADGATQTTASYTIKHQAPLAWRLELPEKVELLSCTVNGTAAQPIQREAGAIELSLPTPKDGSTTVALVYTAKLKALDAVSGDVALELPRTPLFIEHLEWSITVPEAFEVVAVDGNVTVADGETAKTRGEHAIALRKDFCRAERPAVSLFYQRRGLEK